jgi:hypothetical protein
LILGLTWRDRLEFQSKSFEAGIQLVPISQHGLDSVLDVMSLVIAVSAFLQTYQQHKWWLSGMWSLRDMHWRQLQLLWSLEGIAGTCKA